MPEDVLTLSQTACSRVCPCAGAPSLFSEPGTGYGRVKARCPESRRWRERGLQPRWGAESTHQLHFSVACVKPTRSDREGERNNQPFFRLLLLDQIWSEVKLLTNHKGCVSWENISASCDQESVITSADKWNEDDKAKRCILYSRRRIEREMGATAFASAVLLNFGFILGKLSPSNQELSHRLKV